MNDERSFVVVSSHQGPSDLLIITASITFNRVTVVSTGNSLLTLFPNFLDLLNLKSGKSLDRYVVFNRMRV